MKKKIVILIGLIIIALLIGGLALAYNTVWSGSASITIVSSGGGGEPEPPPALIITSVNATDGLIVDGAWSVTLTQGEFETLSVSIENPRNSFVTLQTCINGTAMDSSHYLILGVKLDSTYDVFIPAGSTGVVYWRVFAEASALPGTIPDIPLEIREK